MNDHIKSEISSYLAGVLPESRNRQIEAHAAACEKCRNALSKSRAKQARIKREALKKASSEEMPNLFLDRQRKLLGMNPASGGKSWGIVLLVLVFGTGYWTYHKKMGAPTDRTIVADPISSPTPPAPPPRPPKPEPEAASEAPPKPPPVLHVFQDWKGPDSAITDSRLVVIRNAEAWQKLWTEMALKDPLPEVDFEKKLVLGVFAGEKPAGTSIVLGRVEEYDDEVSAPYRFTLPAAPAAVQTSSDAVATPPAPAATHPYLLAVIPSVDKKIRLTQKEKRS
jgi:hypothetical protein